MTVKDFYREEEFSIFRVKWCLILFFSNSTLAYSINSSSDDAEIWIIYVFALIGCFFLALKALFGIIYIYIESFK